MLRDPRPDNDLLSFESMIETELGSGILPGFACPEIVWERGGRLAGFNPLEARHFTFLDSRTPRLITKQHSEGVELPPAKFLLHWHRAKGGDAVRGGLIRCIAWMHCFQSNGTKFLLRFIERYGMPFTVAKVDEQSWRKDRSKLKSLIQNFGPDGGGVFSKAVELDLLQAATNTGDVYFSLLEYLRGAIERVVLGQTATSGDGGGFSNDGAQHMVRMDIKGSDCRQIAASVNHRLLPYAVAFRYGPDAPVPRMEYDLKPAKDAQAEANVIKTLGEAGWDVDEEQITEATGYKVTRRVAQPPGSSPSTPSTGSTPSTSPSDAAPLSAVRTSLAAALQALGNAAALAADTPDPDLPGDLADSALPAAREALPAWLGPLQADLDRIARIEDPETFASAAAALTADLPARLEEMDTSGFEDVLTETMLAAIAGGKADKAAELAARENQG